MRITHRRAISLLLALALVAGVIASAVLAFVDEAGTFSRLIAVALVAVGGLVPIGQQFVRELAPSPWEGFVTYGRGAPRASEDAVPWSILGVVPGDTLFNVRKVLGGPEETISPDWADGPDSDRRVWNRPHFTFTATVRRDVVTELSVSIEDGAPPGFRIAAPRGFLLGAATVSDLQRQGARAPDQSHLNWYETALGLGMFWQMGPEGSLLLELFVMGSTGEMDSAPLAAIPITGFKLSYERSIHDSNQVWTGWPQLGQLSDGPE